MSQPLKPGENEITLRVILNDRDYDDLERYARIMKKPMHALVEEITMTGKVITHFLDRVREEEKRIIKGGPILAMLQRRLGR